MEITFKQYLIEDAKTRAVVKRVANAINSATDGKYKAMAATKTGSTQPVLAITTDDGKIPTDIYEVFKQNKIGIGDKTSSQNADGSTTIKFFVMDI